MNVLLCRAGTRLCGLPLDRVIETFRPLPVEAVASSSEVVGGLSIVRGEPVPLLDLGRLLGGVAGGERKRWVTLRVESRVVALSVDEVLGVRELDTRSLVELPPLLQSADSKWIETVGRLDAALLLVLGRGYLVPEEALPSSSPPQARLSPSQPSSKGAER